MNYESVYLADAQLKESLTIVAICIAVGTLGLLSRTNNLIDTLLNGAYSRSESKSENSTQSNLVTAGFYCLAFLCFCTDTLTWISLKNNYQETVGTTEGAEGHVTKYEYTVGTEQFTANGSDTYPFNNNFLEIEQQGGKYVVIYDSTDPKVSLIDFNRRVSN